MKQARCQMTLGRVASLIAAAGLAMSLLRTPSGREAGLFGIVVIGYFWAAKTFLLRPLRKRRLQPPLATAIQPP